MNFPPIYVSRVGRMLQNVWFVEEYDKRQN